MANANLTSEERVKVYRLLFRLNRSFHLIVSRLSEADTFGIWSSQDIKEMLGLTQEIQLEINTLLLDRFGTIEDRDYAHFGKLRVAMEKKAQRKGVN